MFIHTLESIVNDMLQQGFIQAAIPPQPQFSLPRNLEIENGYYNYAIYMLLSSVKYVSSKMFGNFIPDCVRSNLRGI